MSEKYVPLDVETTGLKPWDGHLLLEVSAAVIDPASLLYVSPWFEVVIKHDVDEAREKANDYVRAMHDKTGLWDRIATEGVELEEADERLLQFLQASVGEREGYILGNSLRLDANFLEFYMPLSSAWLHYRVIDVTSIAIFAHNSFGVPPMEKTLEHRALADLRESVDELDWIKTRLDQR